jgi:hypothetical protein
VTGSGESSRSADLVLVLHTLFALFAVFGGLLAFADRRVMLVHLPAVAWSSIVNLAGWTCPLTPLEQQLRWRAGQTSYSGGCLHHYLEPVLRPRGMPRQLELVAGVSVLVWNVLVYAAFFWWQGRN